MWHSTMIDLKHGQRCAPWHHGAKPWPTPQHSARSSLRPNAVLLNLNNYASPTRPHGRALLTIEGTVRVGEIKTLQTSALRSGGLGCKAHCCSPKQQHAMRGHEPFADPVAVVGSDGKLHQAPGPGSRAP